MTGNKDKYIHITQEANGDINIKTNTEAYTELFGMLEHAKMQMYLRYNKDYYEPSQNDDDLFKG